MAPRKSAKRGKASVPPLPPLSLADLLHMLPIDAVRKIWASLPRCSKLALSGTCRGIRRLAQQELTERLVVQVKRAYLDLLGKQPATFAQRFAQLRELELRLPIATGGSSGRLDRHIQIDLLDGLGTCPTIKVLRLTKLPLKPDQRRGCCTFKEWQVTPSLMAAIISSFPNLQRLQLEYCGNICEAVFNTLSSSTSLTALDIAGKRYYDISLLSKEGLQSIAGLTTLSSLSLTHVVADEEAVASVSFSALTALTSLACPYAYDFMNEFMPLAESAPALQSLEFRLCNNIPAKVDHMLERLKCMTGLRRLVLDSHLAFWDVMRLAEVLPELTELVTADLSDAFRADHEVMQPHTALRALTTGGAPEDIAIVVGKLPNLEVLRISMKIWTDRYTEENFNGLIEQAEAIARIGAHPSLHTVELQVSVYSYMAKRKKVMDALDVLVPLAGRVTAFKLIPPGMSSGLADISALIMHLAQHYPRLESLMLCDVPRQQLNTMAALSSICTLRHVTMAGPNWRPSRSTADKQKLRPYADELAEAARQLAEAGISVTIGRCCPDLSMALAEFIRGTTWAEKVSCDDFRCPQGSVEWW